MTAHHVFITGASGFMGSRLAAALVARGHSVTALVRNGAERRAPNGCRVVVADPLQGASYAEAVVGCDAFVHLIGVAHPSPARAHEFREIDLKSVQEAVPVARAAGVRHFLYLSVPQPLPIMKAYAAVRAEGESLVRDSGMAATFIRPFYVLGPGRWWPFFLVPVFWLIGSIPPLRSTARRLTPVTVSRVISALCQAIENPPSGVQVLEGNGI